MKTFRISFILALCFFAASFTYATPTYEAPNSELRKEVVKLIKTPELSKKGIAETHAFINFTINEDNEIVVLNIVSDNEYIIGYIKESLDNQKVEAKGLTAFTEYNIKFSFRSEKAWPLSCSLSGASRIL